MFDELSKIIKAIGPHWFRAFVFMWAVLWMWHTFFGSVAEVGKTKTAIAQGDQAGVREPAITGAAVADAALKGERSKYAERLAKAEADAAVAKAESEVEVARQAARKQKADADEAIARACKARAEADPLNRKWGSEPRSVIVLPFDECDPDRRFNADLSEDCEKELRAIVGGFDVGAGLPHVKAWKKKCDYHVRKDVEARLTALYDEWPALVVARLPVSRPAPPQAEPPHLLAPPQPAQRALAPPAKGLWALAETPAPVPTTPTPEPTAPRPNGQTKQVRIHENAGVVRPFERCGASYDKFRHEGISDSKTFATFVVGVQDGLQVCITRIGDTADVAKVAGLARCREMRATRCAVFAVKEMVSAEAAQ